MADANTLKEGSVRKGVDPLEPRNDRAQDRNSSGDDGESSRAQSATTASRDRLTEAAFELFRPEAQGVAARASYLALTNQSVVDNWSVQRALLKIDSPVAQQLMQRWQLMESQGWIFEHAKSSNENFSASYNSRDKIVKYKPQVTLWDHILGANGRLTEATGQVAQELSHHDGHNWYPIGSADAGANAGMARRLLATHARGLVTEAHILQSMNAGPLRSGHLSQTIEALRNNDLGGYIHRTWPDWSKNMEAIDRLYPNPVNAGYRHAQITYPELRFLTEAQARDHVNQYLNETFGSDFFDAKTGKIKAFDINKGIGNMNFPLGEGHPTSPPFGSSYKWIPSERAAKITSPVVDTFDVTVGSAHRALHIAGALGALTMVGDLGTKFGEGVAPGVGRLGKIGVNWAGFEVGMRLSNAVIGRNARPVAGLIGAIGLGAVTAYAADKLIGEELEETLSSELKSFMDNWH